MFYLFIYLRFCEYDTIIYFFLRYLLKQMFSIKNVYLSFEQCPSTTVFRKAIPNGIFRKMQAYSVEFCYPHISRIMSDENVSYLYRIYRIWIYNVQVSKWLLVNQLSSCDFLSYQEQMQFGIKLLRLPKYLTQATTNLVNLSYFTQNGLPFFLCF